MQIMYGPLLLMKIVNSRYNPLLDILDIIPVSGGFLTLGMLQLIGNKFAEGGVICEEVGEVVELLTMLQDNYGLVHIKHLEDDSLFIRK